jgi:hypothetical protein
MAFSFAANGDGKMGKSFKSFSVSNQDDQSSEISATIAKNNNDNQRNSKLVQLYHIICCSSFSYVFSLPQYAIPTNYDRDSD